MLGTGLIAAATDGVTLLAWRAAFLAHDTDEDLVLTRALTLTLALTLALTLT